MCAGPGQELCDECFVRMTEGDIEENWPCEECKERLSHICPRCGFPCDEKLEEDDICSSCVGEINAETGE